CALEVPPNYSNGVTDPEEQCDDGNQSNTDTCLNNCLTATCGDSFVHSGVETCDDGNTVDGDGCEHDCTLPSCSNGIRDPGEVCLSPVAATFIGANPLALAAGDIDGNGTLDIAVASQGDGVVRALLNDGNGVSFLSVSMPSPITGGLLSVALTDV